MRIIILWISLFFLLCFKIDLVAQPTYVNNITTKKKIKPATINLYGQASFYANKFEGRKTASGEIFSHKKFTAACNSLPLGIG